MATNKYHKRYLKKHIFSDEIKSQVNNLKVLDNYHGILAVLEDYAVIASAFCISHFVSFWFFPLSILVIGARQRALTSLLHESAHGILAKNKKLNNFLGSFCSGYLVFQTLNSYRKSHVIGHHGNFGHRQDDPDYHEQICNGLYSNYTEKVFYWKYILAPLVGLRIPRYIAYIIKNRFLNADSNKFEKIELSLLWLSIISIAIYYQALDIIFLYWFVPFITSYMIIGWFSELCEHFPLIDKHDLDIQMTRNRKNPFPEKYLFCIHNEHYHLEHHLCPTIPFWNLKKLNSIHRQDIAFAKIDNESSGIFQAVERNIPNLLGQFIDYAREKLYKK